MFISFDQTLSKAALTRHIPSNTGETNARSFVKDKNANGRPARIHPTVNGQKMCCKRRVSFYGTSLTISIKPMGILSLGRSRSLSTTLRTSVEKKAGQRSSFQIKFSTRSPISPLRWSINSISVTNTWQFVLKN